MDHCLVFCPSTEKMFQTWTAILDKPSFYHVIETVLGWSVKSEISHGAIYEINFWQLGRHNGLFATQISAAVVSCPGWRMRLLEEKLPSLSFSAWMWTSVET